MNSLIYSPSEVFEHVVEGCKLKAKYSWKKLLLLTMIGGAYVGLGATTCLLVGGMVSEAPWNPDETKQNYGMFKLVLGSVGFPMGFLAIMVCGAELYTSLCAYCMAAWLENEITLYEHIKLLVVSWVGNFIGCLWLIGLLYLSEIFDHKDMYLEMMAHDKTHLKWGVVVVRGIFANWLVGIATWMANSARDLTGKAVGVWLPISAFVMIGYEHCVANMFILVMAVAQGGDLTVKQVLWDNIIPATIGNWIGGALLVGAWYSCTYGISYDLKKYIKNTTDKVVIYNNRLFK